ncbi:MAG: AAA family ATPase [Burkholderiales bacterium]
MVALVGPRQVGKTTPARVLVGKSGQAVYLDMERPSDAARLSDAESYLEPLADRLVILDEVQRCAGSGKCSRTITANCGMPRKLPAPWRRV